MLLAHCPVLPSFIVPYLIIAAIVAVGMVGWHGVIDVHGGIAKAIGCQSVYVHWNLGGGAK